MNEEYLSNALDEPVQYKASRYRYVVAILYCASAIMNFALGMCFSPVQINIEKIFDESIYSVNFSTRLVGNFITPPFTFIASYVLDHWGIQPGFIFANICTLSGLWLSTLLSSDFHYILIGQIVSSIGRGFLYNIPQKVSVAWFPANERVLATTIMSMTVLIGNAIGVQFPNFFVDDAAKGPRGLEQLSNMVMFMAIVGTGFIVLTFIFFRGKPASAPSKAAEAKKYPFLKSLKALLTDKNCILLIIGAALAIATNLTIAGTLQFILAPYGFTAGDVSWYITLSIAFGLVSSIYVGHYVNKTKYYKRTLVALAGGTVILLFVSVFATMTQNVYFLGLIFSIFGIIVNPMYPIIVELLCEMSFPVGEAVAGSFFYILSQLFGAGESFIADAILVDETQKDSINAFILIIAMDAVAALSFLLIKQELKRTRYETHNLLEQESNL